MQWQLQWFPGNFVEYIVDYFQKLRCDGVYFVVDRKLFAADEDTDFRWKAMMEKNLVVADDVAAAVARNGFFAGKSAVFEKPVPRIEVPRNAFFPEISISRTGCVSNAAL